MRTSVLVAACLVPAVAFGGFRASSEKKQTQMGEAPFNAASAIDGNHETCWQLNPEDSNEGAWFEIDIPKSEVDKLGVIIGWDVDDDTFNDYARLDTVKIEVMDEAKDGETVLEHSVSFEDKRGWQVIDLPDTAVGNEIFGGKVRVTVKAVYAGKDYPNLAVSEMLVHLKEIDAPVALKSAPESIAPGKAAESLVDDNNGSYWASESAGVGQGFTVGADGWGISSIGIKPGPTSHHRPKTIELTANQVTRTYTLADSTDMQWFPVPAVIGYTGSGWGDVEVKVVDTYEGSNSGVAISEVKLKATSYDGL